MKKVRIKIPENERERIYFTDSEEDIKYLYKYFATNIESFSKILEIPLFKSEKELIYLDTSKGGPGCYYRLESDAEYISRILGKERENYKEKRKIIIDKQFKKHFINKSKKH